MLGDNLEALAPGCIDQKHSSPDFYVNIDSTNL